MSPKFCCLSNVLWNVFASHSLCINMGVLPPSLSISCYRVNKFNRYAIVHAYTIRLSYVDLAFKMSRYKKDTDFTYNAIAFSNLKPPVTRGEALYSPSLPLHAIFAMHLLGKADKPSMYGSNVKLRTITSVQSRRHHIPLLLLASSDRDALVSCWWSAACDAAAILDGDSPDPGELFMLPPNAPLSLCSFSSSLAALPWSSPTTWRIHHNECDCRANADAERRASRDAQSGAEVQRLQEEIETTNNVIPRRRRARGHGDVVHGEGGRC